MEAETVIKKIGGSMYALIPPLYVKHIDAEDGDIIILRDEDDTTTKSINIRKK